MNHEGKEQVMTHLPKVDAETREATETKLEHAHQWAQLVSSICIEKAHGAESINIDIIREAAAEVIEQIKEQLQRDFDEKVLLLQEEVNNLAGERDKMIDSCWYRTKAKKIHWKQGRYFGTSIADYTTTEAYIEAMNAIRHNAGLKPIEELD